MGGTLQLYLPLQVRLFKKPCGVVLNKCLADENPSEQFCLQNAVQILVSIPYDERLGRLNSEGLIVARESREYHELFCKLIDRIELEAVN